MNVLAICADTFRADYLGCYGNEWVHTPCLDTLAKDGVVFEEAYAEGLPTLPARRIFFTGRKLFPRWEVREHKGDPLGFQPAWHAIPDDEPTVAEILSAAADPAHAGSDGSLPPRQTAERAAVGRLASGVTCGFITDVYHCFKPTGNYHRGFQSWEFIRGQESDAWRTGPPLDLGGVGEASRDIELSSLPRGQRQYLLNTAWRRREEDYFAPQVMQAAARWLEDNAENRPFFLWVDCFDPHEPWDPPPHDADLYEARLDDLRLVFAPSKAAGDFSEDELHGIQSLYAGEVTMVDRWIGFLLDRLDALGLADDTAVVFTSDHGTLLGEEGAVHKQPWALVQPLTRIPLLVRLPWEELAGVRIHDYVSAIDVAPTILTLLGQKPQGMDGRDLVPVALRKQKGYDMVVSAYGPYVSLRTRSHNYVAPYRELAGTRWAKDPRPPRLFALDKALAEAEDVTDDEPDTVAGFQARLARILGAT